MNHSKKVLVNTISLYLKIIITCVVQLIATRFALKALGDEAYGLYNLIAGVIILLSFINGALMISVQRFLSIAIGERNEGKLSSIFNVSILLHTILALSIAILFLILEPLLFNGFLKISVELHLTALRIYNIMILSSVITMLTIPYSACINAREDMWYFAVTEIISCLLKLWAAFSLYILHGDLLLIYTGFMLLAIFVSSLLKIIWCRLKYKECVLDFGLMKNKPLFKEMTGFVGWNTLGSGAVVIRNQGVAIILNIFFGTVINAAYGVANQINSLVLSFSTTLTTVFTPSIIQKHGEGDDKGMLEIATLSSKLSFMLSSIMALPIIVYMDEILDFWLHEVPDYTQQFTLWIIISFIILQLYPGINRAIYATGKIKQYQISISVCLTAILPIGYFLLKTGVEPHLLIVLMAILQAICLLITIYFAYKTCHLNIRDFLMRSVLKPIAVFVVILLFSIFVNHYLQANTIVKIIVFAALFDGLFILLFYFLIFNKSEKNRILKLLTRKSIN